MHLTAFCAALQFLQAVPNAAGLLQEIKDNTMHYISVIAEAADSQLSTLSVSGSMKADIYDNLMDAVSGTIRRTALGQYTEMVQPSSQAFQAATWCSGKHRQP